MQLRVARVCLDCEEVHEAKQCPVCASETFAFLTRWVPVDERRHSRPAPRASEPAPPPGASWWVKRGFAGLAVLAAGQWIWHATRSDVDADVSRRSPDRSS
jgi:hypothetical protein